MSAITINIIKHSQFQLFLLSALALFLFKVFFGNTDLTVLIVIAGLLISLYIFLLALYLNNNFYKKDFTPLWKPRQSEEGGRDRQKISAEGGSAYG